MPNYSVDPYAGTVGPNGLLIYTPEEAADNLNRNGMDFTFGNYGAADDGILTYGFWTYEQFLDSYYFEVRYSGGEAYNNDAFYAETYGLFEAFTTAQQEAAAATIQLWDDLIAVEFRQAEEGEIGDIMFGAAYMSTAAGAHAYYPQAEALDNWFGTEGYGQTSGDVMINWYYNSPTGDDAGTILDRPASTMFSNLGIGGYAWFTFAHELGHSLGLAHGGDYNASDGPATYENDAYFYQDSQQYTIMSYFDGAVTGQNAMRWNSTTGGTWMYAQTPAVHDILAVQNVYGADYTTRADDTVYGFNSTADRDVFDFTVNDTPIVTIWDGGGNDTIDVSGFNSDQIIDLNEGAFSSVGYTINADLKALLEGNGWTEADFNALYASWGLGPDGRPVDNLAIAYGAKIENAIGGSGDDMIIGNDLDNMLVGNGGDDTLVGGLGRDQLVGGDGDDFLIGGLGKDELIGGEGADTFIFEDTSKDKIRDFESGVDLIDLTAFEIDASAVKIKGSNLFADTDGDGSYDLHIVVQGDMVQETDILFV